MQRWTVSGSSRETIAYDRGLNLDDLLFHYGVRLNQDLVEDMQCASINLVVGSQGGKPQFQLMPWPYYPLLDGSPTSLITKNLDPVYSRFANSSGYSQGAGYYENEFCCRLHPMQERFQHLRLFLWNRSKQLQTPRLSSSPIFRQVFSWKANSVHSMRTGCRPVIADSLAKVYSQPFLRSGEKTARIIVCADGDVVMNDLSERGTPLPLGFNKDINYTFANAEFLSNCLDYCVNPSGILEARSKDYSLRLLDPEKTEDERSLWQFVNIGLPLVVIVLCGLIFQYIRKRKYNAGTV